MSVLRYLVIFLLALVITFVTNFIGFGFTAPIEFTFDVKARYATDTAIYYRGDSYESFIDRYRDFYLVTVSDNYTNVRLPASNVTVLKQLKFEFDDTNESELCYRNFRVIGRTGSHELYPENFKLEGFEEVYRDDDAICFRIQKNMYDVNHSRPYFETSNFLEYSVIDTFNKWQILYFLGAFAGLMFLWSLVDGYFAGKHKRIVLTELIAFVLFLSIIEFVVLFCLNEVMRAYVLHDSALMLVLCGIILGKFAANFYKFIVTYRYALFSLLLLVLMMMVRYCVFRNDVGIVYRSEFMGYIHIVKQDFPFDVAIVLLFSAGIYTSSKFLKGLFTLFASGFGALMFLDYIMNTEKSDRLIFSRITANTFSHQSLSEIPDAVSHYVSTGQGVLTCAVLTTMLVLSFYVFTCARYRFSFVRFCAYIVILLASLGVYFANIGTSSVFDNKFYNMVDVNRGIENLDFSRVSASSDEVIKLRNGKGYNCNVVVLVVESLSSFASKLYDEKLDLTPNIDRIAQQNIWFKNSYASGYDADVANYALLTKHPFLHNGTHVSDPELYKYTVPRDFKKAGYRTIIMYSSKPSRAQRTQFDEAGFDELFDYMHPDYPNTTPRYERGSLDDKVLLKTAADNIRFWMDNKYNKRNFFVEILTSSGMPPYVVPVEKRVDPTKVEYDLFTVTKFTDEAIGDFVAELEKMNFFSNGILVITGNRRAPVTLSKREYDLYGSIGITRVPLILIDKKQKPRMYDNDISTISIGEMIEYLALNKYESSSMHVNPLIDNSNEIIIYQQLSPRNTILLKNGDTYGEFVIDGNRSRINGNLRNSDEIYTNILAFLSHKEFLRPAISYDENYSYSNRHDYTSFDSDFDLPKGAAAFSPEDHYADKKVKVNDESDEIELGTIISKNIDYENTRKLKGRK